MGCSCGGRSRLAILHTPAGQHQRGRTSTSTSPAEPHSGHFSSQIARQRHCCWVFSDCLTSHPPLPSVTRCYSAFNLTLGSVSKHPPTSECEHESCERLPRQVSELQADGRQGEGDQEARGEARQVSGVFISSSFCFIKIITFFHAHVAVER